MKSRPAVRPIATLRLVPLRPKNRLPPNMVLVVIEIKIGATQGGLATLRVQLRSILAFCEDIMVAAERCRLEDTALGNGVMSVGRTPLAIR